MWRWGLALGAVWLLVRTPLGRRAFEVVRNLVRSGRAFTVVLFLAAVFLTVPLSWTPAYAAVSSVTTGGASSCVSAWEGQALGSFTWSAGQTRTLLVKCYYGNAPTGWAFPYESTFTPDASSTGHYIDFPRSDGNGDYAQPAGLTSGTNKLVWTNFEWLVSDPSTRYVEWSVDIQLYGTSRTFNQNGLAARPAHAFWRVAEQANPPYRMNDANTHGTTPAHGGRWVAGADWASTSPHYWWLSEYSPIVPFCGAVVDWDDADDVRVFEGDELGFSYTRTAGVTGNIEVRWNPGLSVGGWGADPGPWHLLLSEATIGTSGTGSIVAGDRGAFDGGYLGLIEMRCYNIPTNTYLYKRFGDDSETVGDGAARPCLRTRVTWPPMDNLEAGDDVSWYFSHTGVGDVLVEVTSWDDGNLDAPPAFSSLTWTTLADLSPGEYGDFSEPAGYDGTTRQMVLRCTDAQGVFYGAPWASAVRLIDPDAGPGEEGCYSQTGIGLRPSSWVPGLARMGSCTLQVLFVPSSGVVQEEWEELLEAAEENAPVAWVYDAYSLVSDAAVGTSAAVAASSGECVQVVPDGGDLIDSSAGSVCPATLDVGPLATARPYMGFMVWIGWAWSMYSALFRKAPASTEPEQLTLF